jgi:hypothetical protein
MGPIDWTHPIAAKMPEHWRDAEKHPERYEFLFSGMLTARKVLRLRMYDGWPYWKPTPAILRESPLGGYEWTFFNSYGVNEHSLYLRQDAPAS